MVLFFCDFSVLAHVDGLEIGDLIIPILLLDCEDVLGVLLSEELGLEVLHLFKFRLLLSLVSLTNLLVFTIHDFDSVILLFIRSLLFSNVFLGDLNRLFEIILLVVELFFQGKEVLIQRNTISKQGFVSRRLVLLVDLTIFQKFDFVFHKDDLFLKVQNVLLFES